MATILTTHEHFCRLDGITIIINTFVSLTRWKINVPTINYQDRCSQMSPLPPETENNPPLVKGRDYRKVDCISAAGELEIVLISVWLMDRLLAASPPCKVVCGKEEDKQKKIQEEIKITAAVALIYTLIMLEDDFDLSHVEMSPKYQAEVRKRISWIVCDMRFVFPLWVVQNYNHGKTQWGEEEHSLFYHLLIRLAMAGELSHCGDPMIFFRTLPLDPKIGGEETILRDNRPLAWAINIVNGWARIDPTTNPYSILQCSIHGRKIIEMESIFQQYQLARANHDISAIKRYEWAFSSL